jgi:hypothetical protein
VVDTEEFSAALSGNETTFAQNTIISHPEDIPATDCAGPIVSLGNNLISDPAGCDITLQPSDHTGDPGLDSFVDNGSPGNGHFTLLKTSQAIDAGNDAACPKRDQIGQLRKRPCDIGAIEFQEKKPQRTK